MSREFVPPGPGSWSLESTHFSSAVPLYSQRIISDGMARGFEESGLRYGLMLKMLRTEFVNSFAYSSEVMVGEPDDPSGGPPPSWLLFLLSRLLPEFRTRNRNFLNAVKSEMWLEDLAEWDDTYKPDSIRRNLALVDVSLQDLTDDELEKHLEAVRENLGEMYYRHHRYSVPSVFPVGLYLHHVTSTGKISVGEAIAALRGSTPVSTGAYADKLETLKEAIEAAGSGKAQLASIAPGEFLTTLRGLGSEVAAALEDYLRHVGQMLVSGYATSEKTVNEVPLILKTRVLNAFDGAPAPSADDLVESLRSRLSGEERETFDTWFDHACTVNRMRDERGVYNDIWAAGIARTAILEAGRRLEERGVLPSAELAIDASHEELSAFLKGEPAVSVETLTERRDWRLKMRQEDVPQWLGHPPSSDPPPLSILPAGLKLGTAALLLAMGNVFDEDEVTEDGSSAPVEEGLSELTGLAVSPGVYEGTARVISGPEDFERLEQGDVLVTKNTSAAFNVVLPLLGALVTDRGGLLSHAAIVSREYGIPSVVATKTSTRSITDGCRVRVDGDNGTVTILT